MPGPSYQQFQGYPDPVRNYFAGQDAGRARAVEDSNTEQTLETQNALVQQSGAQSYPQLQAQQMQLKAFHDQYYPMLEMAQKTGNDAVREQIAKTALASNLPQLKQAGELLSKMKFLGQEDMELPLDFTNEAGKKKFVDKYGTYLDAAGISADALFGKGTMQFKGALGGDMRPVKFVPSKTVAKSYPVQTPMKTADDKQRLLADPAYQDPTIQNLISNTDPGSGVSFMLTGKDEDGVFHGGAVTKVPYQKPQPDSVSSLEGLQAAVADAPPAIAQKILPEATRAIKKGFIVVLARDANGKLTGSISSEKRPPSAGGAGAAGNVELTENAQRMLALAMEKGMTIPVPSFGMGAAAVNDRKRVLNRMADNLVASGKPMSEAISEVGLAKAGRSSSEAELKRIKAQRGPVMAFARNAELNLKRAIDMVDKIPDTEIPVINRALRSGAAKIGGSPAVASFYAALYTGVNEYAKVTSSATGGGVTAQAAREEAADALGRGGYTAKQYKQILKTVLLPDLASRQQGYDERIKYTEDALRGTSGVESAAGKVGTKTLPKKPPKSAADVLATMMAANPGMTREQIKAQPAYKKRLAAFGLEDK